jgi:hypothetical protein
MHKRVKTPTFAEQHVEPAIESLRELNGRAEKCTTSARVPLTVSVGIRDVEPVAGSNEAALRLVCRAMVRLYLQDCEDPMHGKRLGVL